MAFRNTRPSSQPRSTRPGHRQFGPPRNNRSKVSRGAYINPIKFVNKAVQAADEVIYEPKHTFLDFAFGSDLQRNIDAKGYTQPSAIQDQSIPYILDGKDVIGLANTGTGKTAAFVLPIIEKLTNSPGIPTVLIMAPTRELAVQINEEFRIFSNGMRLFSTLVVGGMNIDRQIRDLRRRPHVVIGTPGRLKDLMKRKELKLDQIRCLVLDEADRMLDMGFINDIRAIVKEAPKERQTLFFSATITPTIQNLISEFLNDPIEISVRTADTSEHVEQDIVESDSKEHKLDLLLDMLSKEDFDKVLVFGETKFGVQRLSDHLEQSGIPSIAIHGNKSQSQRQRALKSFKENKVRVMVATDVAARGLDIPNVSHVINFDQPATYEDYVHRIGRTGRGGASGKAFTFVPRVRR
ncbi:MAG: DEAD/DEAH box helicase [Candidatus Microsaccharimonas sp.]